MKHLTLLFISLVSFLAWSQPQQLNIPAKEVANTFQAGGSVQWAFPLSEHKSEPLLWQERMTSFSAKGIRSFVGYKGSTLAGVISIHQGRVSGSYTLGNSIQLSTDANGLLTIERIGGMESGCGTGHHCHATACEQITATPQTSYSPLFLTQTSEFSKQRYADGANEEGAIKYFQDNVLRIYRIALAVQPEFFVDVYKNDKTKVRQLWADAESFLNELYMRDVGVKFQVIDDEKLMLTSDTYFSTRNGRNTLSNVIKNSSKGFDDLLGRKNYDVGFVVCKNSEYNEKTKSGLLGLAYTYAVHLDNQKGGASGWNDVKTIAHEVGHLFGAQHVFTKGGVGSVRTEPEGGTSVMSYGAPMDFFSLVSLSHIKRELSNAPYYSGTTKIGKDYRFTPPGETGLFQITNFVQGVSTKNTAPILDRTHLKPIYEIPEGSILQFTLKGEDPDGNPLHYAAQQADVELKSEQNISYSKAVFTTYKPSTNNSITFLPEYLPHLKEVGRDDYISYPAAQNNLKPGDEFTFWLSVSDPDVSEGYQMRSNHAVQYDIYETKVKIVKGTPFKITNEFKKKYLQGETIPLTWSVDPSLSGTNVRILLSDDFGKTYKHVLVEKAPNNGAYNLPVPNISIGQTIYNHYEVNYGSLTDLQIPAGVIKIEVIEAPVCAVSEWRAYSLKLISGKKEDETMVLTRDGGKLRYSGTTIGLDQTFGGFEIEASKIKFSKLPESAITVSCDNLPADHNAEGVEATNSMCSGGVSVNYREEGKKTECTDKTKYTYKRIWSATDKCGTAPVDFVQIVTVTPKGYTPIEVQIPADVKISCEQGVPTPDKNTVKASGGCGTLDISFTDEKTKQSCTNTYTLNRTWIVSDQCGEVIKRVQTIVVEDKNPPTFKGELPQNLAMSNDEYRTFSAERTANPHKIIAFDACDGKDIEVAHPTPTRSANYRTGNTEYTYTWEATDSCGNKVKHQQIVAVSTTRPSVPTTPTEPADPNTQPTPPANPGDLYIDIPTEVEIDCMENRPVYGYDKIKNGSNNYSISESRRRVDGSKCHEVWDITYTVRDVETRKTAQKLQRLTQVDKVAPVFLSALPQDKQMTQAEFNNYKTPTLIANDACQNTRTNVQGTRTERQEGNNKVYDYVWVAEDVCGNQRTHKQSITIVAAGQAPTVPTTPPANPSGENPSTPPTNPTEPNTPSDVHTPNTPSVPSHPAIEWSIAPEIEVECETQIPTYDHSHLRGGNNPKMGLPKDEGKRSLGPCGDYEFDRIYTAVNADGSGLVNFTQKIRIKDKTAPQYVNMPNMSNLDLSEEQFKDFKPAVLVVSDEKCGEFIGDKRVEPQTDIKDEGEWRRYIYTYNAQDACGNKAPTITQVVSVRKGSTGVIDAIPTANTDENQAGGDKNPIIYNWVIPSSEENVFRFNDTFTENIKNLHLRIYTQMGFLIYESTDYNQEVKDGKGFKGYANTNGKYRLLQGETYFYTFTYQTPSGFYQRKSGYIYVDGHSTKTSK